MLEFLNCPRPDGYSPAQLMFGRHMRSALLAATGAVEPVSLEVAEKARRKTHDAALAEIGNRRLKNSMKGMKCGCRIGSLGPGTRTPLCWGSGMGVLHSPFTSPTRRKSLGETRDSSV